MIGLSRSKNQMFNKPFRCKASTGYFERDYRVVAEEEPMEEIYFPIHRRVSMVAAPTHGEFSIEIATIDPLDLHAALDRDALR